MSDNSITPSKGGRTQTLGGVRIRPDIKAQLKSLAKKKGISMADLIELWVLENYK